MKQKRFLLLALMVALAVISVRAEHTLTLDLANVSKSNNDDSKIAYNSETKTITFGTTWQALYWSATTYMASFTTATLVVDRTEEANNMAIAITVRYTKTGESSTSDVFTTIDANSTSGSVTIPTDGTLHSIRVANRSATGSVKLVSVTLSGLKETECAIPLIDVSSSPVAINWNQEASKTVAASALANARVGDYIQVTVVGTGNMQCAIRNNSHTPVINTMNYTENSVTEQRIIRYGLTNAGVAEILTGGIYLAGTECNLKKVELILTSEPEDFSNTIWFGEKVCSWNGVQMRTANYAAAQNGWTLRIHHKNLGGSPRLGLYNAYTAAITGHDYAAVSGEYTDYTVDEAMLTVMATDNFFVRGNDLTITKIELLSSTKTLDVTTVLYEGDTPLANWSKNYEQPASIINSLQAGDVLKVTVSGNANDNTNCQLRIVWNTGDGNFVGQTGIYNLGFPYTYTWTLTADEVNTIKTAGKLYLNGCNIVVSKWTLTQQKTVSRERGNAATTIWTGSQAIDWSVSPSTYATVEAAAFANAAAGMKLRMNFSNMKLGAQGRIVKGDWSAFTDANTYEKLPTAWGDYYEFTLTDDMVTDLKANGMHVTGVGFTLNSVELINPMKEYVINATFDSDDIIAWEPSQGTPNLTVTLTNHEEEAVTTTISASLMTDMFADYNNYSQNVTLAAGETKTIDLEFSNLQPGFYRMAAKANNNMLCTYYIGYNPTAIVSPDDSQPDFATFWNTWKTRLDAIPIDAELTLLNGSTAGDTRNIYEVKYKSVPETVGGEPVYIYGYYAEPKAEGTYPCIIHFHGTDKSGNLTMPSGTTEGWCEFRFSARGQTLDKAKNGSEKYRTNPSEESSVDFYAYELGDNDKHYYRYVYLDTRRAVDFVCSKAKVNKDAIFAAGGSQGGCLTYVCAALSGGRIRAIAPSITGHADFVHTMEIVGWPTNVFNDWINAKVAAGTYANYEAGKAALLKHQSYFDTKNFAKWITCPVITNFSLQDNTDGPHLNISPYNLLVNVPASDKQYSINQFKGHATANDWSTTYMTFFQNYITTGAQQQSYIVNSGQDGWATLYLDFNASIPSGATAYIVTAKMETDHTLALKRIDGGVLNANTAAIIKGNNTYQDYIFYQTAESGVEQGTNLLKGVNERTAISTLSANGIFALGKAEGQIGFYTANTDYLPAHKAYLPKTSVASTRGYTFNYGGTTGITGITSTELDNNAYYDLQGRLVEHPSKGIYLHNGRKVIIK